MRGRGKSVTPIPARHPATPFFPPSRVMFIAMGLCAVTVIILTRLAMGLAPQAPLLRDGAGWHAHEMIFGFAGAGFAGYSLTAMTSWSVRFIMSPGRVAILLALWIIARFAAWGSLGGNLWLAVPAATGFMACTSAYLLRAVWKSGTARGAPQAFLALFLTGSQVAFLCGGGQTLLPVLGLSLLLSVVGGRMVSAFTRSRSNPGPDLAPRFRAARASGIVGSAAICTAGIAQAAGLGAGWLVPVLLFAALAELARWLLWQSRQVWQDSLLVMLHLGFLWLPAGLALVALSHLDAGLISDSDALHALTAGAIACSLQAVAARAVATRADRLCASRIDRIAFALLWLGALLRVMPLADTPFRGIAAVLWALSWLLFVIRHMVALRHPPPRPVFSGPRTRSLPD